MKTNIIELKNKQMLWARNLTDEQAKDVLLTLIWESNYTFVQGILREKIEKDTA